VDEQNDEYRSGQSTHGMKGTVIPSSLKGAALKNSSDSGVRFDPHKPSFNYNIVSVDETGAEKRVGVTAEEHAQMVRNIRDGVVVTNDEIVKKGSEPVHNSTLPLDTVKTAPPIDDSSPGTEDRISFPKPVRVTSSLINPAPVVVKTRDPLRREPAVVETRVKEKEPEKTPVEVPVEPPKTLEANKPVTRRPTDLDLEPDPTPGPEQVSSYSVERDDGGKIKPLLAPIESPGGAELHDDNLDRSEGINLGEMPNIPAHAPESKGMPIHKPNVNLHSAPMRSQRIKVRFISRLGKLAVPYNLVFRYGMSLVMIQHSEEGIFYDPPQASDLEIEVWWHGSVYICFPGVYIEFPDHQTAQTIFFVDEELTRAKRQQLASQGHG
jgi:hypothetical protein